MLDIKKIYKKCTVRKAEEGFADTIKADTIRSCIISPFAVWCEKYAPKEEKDPETKYTKLLFKRGRQHEKETVARLFPGLKPLKFDNFKKGFLMLLEYLSKGKAALWNTPLLYLPENLLVKLDLLIKDSSHKSSFGNYHYIYKEIKSAAHLRQEHILPTAFGNYVLGKIQDYMPEYFYIINRDGEETQFRYEEYEDEMHAIIKEIKEIHSGKITPPAIPGACGRSWRTYGLKKAKESEDVSLVPGIGKEIRDKLIVKGIKTLSDLAKLDVFPEIPERSILIARAIKQNKHMVIEKPSFPKAETEIFLDMESTDYFREKDKIIKVDYLIGMLVREKNKEEYKYFFAHKLEEEKEIFKKFLDFLEKKKDFVIYHYHHYEKTRFNAFCEKYNINKDLRDKILKKMIDIGPLTKKCVALPVNSYDLKAIGSYLGSKWKTNLDGMECVALYLEYIKDKDKKKLKDILDYNKEDCKATAKLKDFLAGL